MLFQTELDAESGAPKDELAPDTLSWFKTLGVDYKKLSEVIAAGPCPKVAFCLKSHHVEIISFRFSFKFLFSF